MTRMLSVVGVSLSVAALATMLLACGTTSGSKTDAPAQKTVAKKETVKQPKAEAKPKTVSNPLVALRVIFTTGTVEDPKGKNGLAALTAAMVAKGGTQKLAYADVLNAMYPMATSLGVYVTKEQTVFYGTVHKDNLEKYAALFGDLLLTPRFDKADFERLSKKALDHVTKTLRSNDDEELGKHALHDLMYRNHPYQTPNAGTVKGLGAITMDDVKAFYGKFYARDRIHVGVAGGAPAGFTAAFEKRLVAALPKTSPKRAALPDAPEAKGLKVLLVQKNTRSAAISMGHPLPITRKDDDFYPLFLAASYLGEHRTFNGVLMQNMRGKRGMNYGDYAYVETFLQDGWSTFPLPNIQRRQQHFEIWIRPVVPANAAFAIRQAIYEADKLVKEGIPQQGFEDTRSYLMSFSKLWTQDAGRRLGYAMDGKLVGREIAAELQKRLPSLTKADVDRVIKKYLRPGDLRIAVAVKDAKALKKQLLSGKPTPIKYDTKGTPKEILDEDKVIQKYPLKLKKKQVQVLKASELFN